MPGRLPLYIYSAGISAFHRKETDIVAADIVAADIVATDIVADSPRHSAVVAK
jgi:hypothetical protein